MALTTRQQAINIFKSEHNLDLERGLCKIIERPDCVYAHYDVDQYIDYMGPFHSVYNLPIYVEYRGAM